MPLLPSSVPTFAEQLRQYRRAAGLTQAELAERAGLSVYSISNIERGVQHIPRQETLRLLSASLVLSPTDETTLFAARAAAWPSPVDCPSPIRGSSLPRLLVPLVSREQEISQLVALLQDPAQHLITLTGPAGVGKTALALSVATLVQSSFADGARFISLSTCMDSQSALYTLARGMDLKEQPGSSLSQQVIDVLQEHQQLLLLDNCEQIEGIADLILSVLQACPHLTILVTSRLRLHVQGEQTMVLAPLAVPDLATLPPLANLQCMPAVAFLVQRIQAYQPGFTLTEENAATVAALCVRLDGLPLALELAAARCRLFTPAEMLARLQGLKGSFAALVGGPKNLPSRQQSLYAALQWSHELLSSSEQILFRRLAVFVDGATLPAIDAICLHAPLCDAPSDLLVEELLDHSLLQRTEHGGETRFTLLETIRAFALEKLQASPDEQNLRQVHAHYFLALAEAVESELRGPHQQLGQTRLRDEYANVTAALDWVLTHQEYELSLRFVSALWRYWYQRNMLSEGNEWLARALAPDIPVGYQKLRADALNGAGWLAFGQADYPRAGRLHTASHALSREVSDDAGIARALNNLGGIARLQGEYAEAQSLFEESLLYFQRIHDTFGISAALSNLAAVFWSLGEYRRAQTLAEASLALDEELGDRSGMALTMEGLGLLAIDMDDLARAEQWFDQAVSIGREVKDTRRVARVLRNQGDIWRLQGDLSRARACYAESWALLQDSEDRPAIAATWQSQGHLALAQGHLSEAQEWYARSLRTFVELGSKREIAQCFEGLAQVHSQAGAPQTQQSLSQAVTFLAGAVALRRAAKARSSDREDRCRAETHAYLCHMLGERRFHAAWQAGEAATPESLLALVSVP